VSPRVSVIIPFKRAGAYLEECLAHLERQTFRDFDIYLVPDEPLTRAGSNLHVIASGPVLPNRKRQNAAEASSAEILAFIDDDAYADPAWLANAVRHFDNPDVVAAGGPAVTPPEDSPSQRASGAIFASAVVTATTRHRYVAEPQHDVDGLPSCNLLVRRDAFLRDAEASVRFWPGEDILLCMFAARDGARIVYDPEALVFHHRRAVFAPHLRQVCDAVYAVPAAFVLAHAGLLAALTQPRLRAPATLAAAAYLALIASSAGREARAARVSPWLVTAGIYLTHLTYGSGTITGWLCGVAKRGD
jgi:GT2 family glycosyltransferase